jgi:phosphomethylpyrimidine synthase
MRGPKFRSMKIAQNVRDCTAKLNDQNFSSLAEGGGSGSARSAETMGALGEAERLRGMEEMSAKFAEVGKELYISESGKKREAID